jgi:outer membrane protein assembly factor BamE (lipoprotein component of BamABCDE complex)
MTIMRATWFAIGAAALATFGTYCAIGAARAEQGASSAPAAAHVIPGKSTKADIQSMLGAPWRVVMFNDCGEAMDDQADETWEYRGKDAGGNYRIHVEFDDHGVVHLFAKVPDNPGDANGTVAKVAPTARSQGMSM